MTDVQTQTSGVRVDSGVTTRVGLPTLLGVVLVLVVGGVLTITGTLTWGAYFRDASLLLGLLGIGHGIDAHSRP